MGNRSVVLLSGGLDSAANLAFCREQDEPIFALTVDYGQRAKVREIAAARALAAHYGCRHEVVSVPWLGSLGGSALTEASRPVPGFAVDRLDDLDYSRETARSVWVPNRNGVLINIAASFAERLGAKQVVVGFNREEAATFPDNSEAYLEAASRALRYSTAERVQVTSYTVEWDKRQIVRELRALPRTFPFDLVWSCYLGGESPCGTCESCRRFARAVGKG